MKKRVINILSSVWIATSLVGCGGGSENNNSVPAPSTPDTQSSRTLNGTWKLQDKLCNNKSVPDVVNLKVGFSSFTIAVQDKAGTLTIMDSETHYPSSSFNVEKLSADQIKIQHSVNSSGTTLEEGFNGTFIYQMTDTQLTITQVDNKTCEDWSAVTFEFSRF